MWFIKVYFPALDTWLFDAFGALVYGHKQAIGSSSRVTMLRMAVDRGYNFDERGEKWQLVRITKNGEVEIPLDEWAKLPRKGKKGGG